MYNYYCNSFQNKITASYSSTKAENNNISLSVKKSLVVALILKVIIMNVSHNFRGMSINKYFKMVHGNGRKGFNIALWNCRRGLLSEDGLPSEKFTEILNFLQSKHPHLFCLVELDLHTKQSRIKKQNYVSLVH